MKTIYRCHFGLLSRYPLHKKCYFKHLKNEKLILLLNMSKSLFGNIACHPTITTRKHAISGAPKMLSVAHGGCATVSSPLKCVFCGACLGAPQKAQVSVAHCTWCATEIFQWRISLVCATEINAPQKQKYMRHRIIYRYSEIAAACCINTGLLQEI